MVLISKVGMNKKQFKLKYPKCQICLEDTPYKLRDVHRIVPGSKYLPHQCVSVCANCHRRIHAGFITDVRKHTSTAGTLVIYLDKNNKEVINRI